MAIYTAVFISAFLINSSLKPCSVCCTVGQNICFGVTCKSKSAPLLIWKSLSVFKMMTIAHDDNAVIYLWSDRRKGQIDTAVAESPTSRAEEQGITALSFMPTGSPEPWWPHIITCHHEQACKINDTFQCTLKTKLWYSIDLNGQKDRLYWCIYRILETYRLTMYIRTNWWSYDAQRPKFVFC